MVADWGKRPSDSLGEFDAGQRSVSVERCRRRTRKAEEVFEEMSRQGLALDIYLYTAMINGYCRTGNMKRALSLFDECVERGLEPNEQTYGTLINGLCKLGQLNAAEMLMDEMQPKGINHLSRRISAHVIPIRSAPCKEHSDAAMQVIRHIQKTPMIGDSFKKIATHGYELFVTQIVQTVRSCIVL